MNNSPLKSAKAWYPWAGLALFIALALLAALCIRAEHPPQVVRADAPPSEFSAERAQRHLTAIAHAPHPIGSAGALAVRDYLVRELGAAGLDPQVQQATAVNAGWGTPIPAGTVNNVVARLRGTDSTKAVLLVAHYDSVSHSYGAADDGAGVAAMLETLHALQAGGRLRNDVIFLFTDGEEAGLLGAQAFVKEHPWAADVGLALNFEARGSRGPSLMFETSDGNGWLIDGFAKAAPVPVASSLLYEIYRVLPNDTDLSAFKRAGVPGLNFAFIEGTVNYHSLNDRLEHLDGRSLQHHGSYALALTRYFGNLSLEPRRTGNEIYFNLFGANLVHYSAAWSVPLMLLVVLLFAAVLVVGFRRRRLSVRGLIRGFLFLFTSMLAAAVTVTLIRWTLGKLHPQYDAQLMGDTYNSSLYFVACAALTVAITATLYVWFGRRGGVESFLLGTLSWWLLLSVLTSLFLPGASYLFVWPLCFTLAALAYRLSAPAPEGVPPLKYVMAHFAAAVPCVLLLAPTIKMMFVALTFTAAGAVVVFVVLLVGLLLPLLDSGNAAHRWLLPAAAGVLALGFIVAGELTARVDQTHPRPDTVFYCLDADSNRAVWVSPDGAPDEWLRQFFGVGAGRGALPECLPHSSRTFMKNEAAVIAEPAPQAELLDDRRQGDARTLRLHIASPRGANVISVFLDRNVELRSAAVNDHPLAPSAARDAQQPWGLLYYGVPQEGIVLTLEVSAGSAPVRVRVVDQTPALPVAPNLTYRARPADSIPSTYVVSDSTLVAKSFSF